VGRIATVAATGVAVLTAALASHFSNIMDYLQVLFGFFNAPLFATFILGMFWKRMTPTAGWVGLVAGTASAVVVAILTQGTLGSYSTGLIHVGGQGAAFLCASAAFVVDVVLSIAISVVTRPKPADELVGLVYSETPAEMRTDPHESSYPWYQRPAPLAGIALVMVIILNAIF
jgi:SSS family solute:Na+ symporter